MQIRRRFTSLLTLGLALAGLFHYGFRQPLLAKPVTSKPIKKNRPAPKERPNPYSAVIVDGQPNFKNYLQTLKTESDFIKRSSEREYWEAIANLSPFFGDLKVTFKARSKAWRDPSQTIDTQISECHPSDAIEFVLSQAEKHQVIMFGEEHMHPQTRCLLVPLLKGLKDKGYKYFAAETFSDNAHIMEETNKRGQALTHTGFYMRDPIYAEAVHEALRLGYKLVPYESDFSAEPREVKAAGGNKSQNWRESAQARNLKSIFDKDKKAKVFVWAGRGHVYLAPSSDKDNTGEPWKPMGFVFQNITGITPLSLIGVNGTEIENRNKETPEYKYAEAQGWLKQGPVILRSPNGTPYDRGGKAIEVFFPRQHQLHGRADWMATVIDRVPTPIPEKLIAANATQLAEVFYEGNLVDAAPIDCVVIRPGEPTPFLMLPRHGHFVVRIRDADNKIRGQKILESKSLPE